MHISFTYHFLTYEAMQIITYMQTYTIMNPNGKAIQSLNNQHTYHAYKHGEAIQDSTTDSFTFNSTCECHSILNQLSFYLV